MAKISKERQETWHTAVERMFKAANALKAAVALDDVSGENYHSTRKSVTAARDAFKSCEATEEKAWAKLQEPDPQQDIPGTEKGSKRGAKALEQTPFETMTPEAVAKATGQPLEEAPVAT